MQYQTGDVAGSTFWYLAYTESRREPYAREQLNRQGYETYLPLYGHSEPLFPRYLFLRPSRPTQSIAPARSTRGVQTVVRFGCLYARVPHSLIEHIKEQETLRRNDAAAARIPQAGQRVRVKTNAPGLAGLEGLVHSSAQQRVIILMEILGRQTPVRMQVQNIEVI